MPLISTPSALIILDGFGYRKNPYCNAIFQACTPTFDYLWHHYPHAILAASGAAVGLPDGYIGNSQIGHRIIGSGRIIEQPLTIINKSISKQTIESETLSQLLQSLQNSEHSLHIMGLLSDAGVHSHINHLIAFLKGAEKYHISNIILHLFLDGRDTQPKSAMAYIDQINYIINHSSIPICIGSITGRFYAMDRDENWERTKATYDILVEQNNKSFNDTQDAINYYYNKHISDEFIPPTQLKCFKPIEPQDGVIFFNFRPDRSCQLTEALINKNFKHFPTKQLNLAFFLTPFPYSPFLKTISLFKLPNIRNTLKQVLINANKSVFTIAETEKYAHVTYFFAGGNHKLGMEQTNILIPSIKLKNYIYHPCMQAKIITDTIINSLQHHPFDFYIINYANADMVGHSGNIAATIKAIECLDQEIQRLYEELVVKHNGTIYLTADHGNAEDMTATWLTSHTPNPVPFIMIKKSIEGSRKTVLPLSSLSDIAPFILQDLSIPIPNEMLNKKTINTSNK